MSCFELVTPTDELVSVTIRLAYFWISNYISHIVGSFLAVGLLKLRGVNGLAGWRYLFLVEGCFTCIVGIISFFLMPAGPTQTRSKIFPRGWFTERCILVLPFSIVLY
jgi:hypothetical protein